MIQEHEIVLYQVEGTNICVNVVFKDETFWMTQKAMAELFDVNVPAISKHLMAEDEVLMSMQDWVEQTNQFLRNNRREVLEGKGKVSHDMVQKRQF